jgi:hypothetical protein
VNLEEAGVIVGRMRGTWPRMYLVDDGLDVWTDYFLEQDFEPVVFALHKLSKERATPPAIKDFADVVEGENAHRFKCPHCGLGFKTEARVQEHVENIHW